MAKYNQPSDERIEEILGTLSFGDEMVMRKYIKHLKAKGERNEGLHK
jgi:hypothetical protein